MHIVCTKSYVYSMYAHMSVHLCIHASVCVCVCELVLLYVRVLLLFVAAVVVFNKFYVI